MNYKNRTLLFILLFLTFGVHIAQHDVDVYAWVILTLQFLLYPHVVYLRALMSAKPAQAELHNMMIDGIIFGMWISALGFPSWISITLTLAIFYNLLVFMGPKGFLPAIGSLSMGALLAIGMLGFKFNPNTDPATALACFICAFVYLCVMACGVYFHAVRLQETRRRLRLSEQALKNANQGLQHQINAVHGMQSKLSDQANRDPLTGLFNRRYLDSSIHRELARCQRENLTLSMILIDIDNFKTINDTFGHQAGDEVLKKLASMLRARSSDISSRYGGEEFLMILPSMPLSNAIERAEWVRKTFAASPIAYGDANIQATLSIGISSYPNHAQSPAELIRCADAALYRAKAKGKNCVFVGATPSLSAA
jgi:diguanylate cyclase